MSEEAKRPSHLPENATKAFQGTIFSIWQWPQTIYDGSVKTFEKAQRADTVFVLPVMDDGRIMMIIDEQPHREPILTLPAGRMEEGEEPELAMKREFLEETGYEARSWKPWYSYQPMGKVIWNMYGFIARDLVFTKEADPGAGEKITITPHTFEEFIAIVRSDKIHDPTLKSYILEALLDERKMKEFKHLLYG